MGGGTTRPYGQTIIGWTSVWLYICQDEEADKTRRQRQTISISYSRQAVNSLCETIKFKFPSSGLALVRHVVEMGPPVISCLRNVTVGGSARTERTRKLIISMDVRVSNKVF